MEGNRARGGSTPSGAADGRRQQQAGNQRATTTPPPPVETRGGGHRGPRTATPPASHARGGRLAGDGLTARQQHQQQLKTSSPPTDPPLARHVFNLYRQCVAAGQWACVSVEQLRDGELISLSSRPWAAATAAARDYPGPQPKRKRRPNAKRQAKKKLWRHSRGDGAVAANSGQLHQPTGAGAVGQRQQGPSSCQLPSHRQAPANGQELHPKPVRAAAAAAGTYAQAAAKAAVYTTTALDATGTEGAEGPAPGGTTATLPETTTAAVDSSSCPLVTSPRLTRGRKRRKEMSPDDISIITQLDGVDGSPPPSPREASPEPPSPAAGPRLAAPSEPVEEPQEQADPPELTGAPPPPSWSPNLPSYWEQVICKYCLKGRHNYSRFQSCLACSITMK